MGLSEFLEHFGLFFELALVGQILLLHGSLIRHSFEILIFGFGFLCAKLARTYVLIRIRTSAESFLSWSSIAERS